jgi:hypothetical protein
MSHICKGEGKVLSNFMLIHKHEEFMIFQWGQEGKRGELRIKYLSIEEFLFAIKD